jgi:hypothetical protein
VKPTNPAIVSAGSTPGLAIQPYTSILMYIKKSIHDFDSILLFELVLQNGAKTDNATINALKTLMESYITYLNTIITTFKLDDGTLDKKYYRILGEIEKVLVKINMIVPSAKSLDVNVFVPLVEPYVPPGAGSAPPTAPDAIIMEISKSIVKSINAMVTQKKLDTINTPEKIKAINTLPLLITRLVKHFSGSNTIFLTGLGIFEFVRDQMRGIYPIPAATASLFDTGLNKNTFLVNLTKPTVGIIPFITTNYLTLFAQNSIKKTIDKAKNDGGQTKVLASSFVNKMFEYYISLLNTLINIFEITLTADPLIKPHLEVITTLLQKTDYKLLLAPAAPAPAFGARAATKAPSGPSGPSGPRATGGGRRTSRRKRGRGRGRARRSRRTRR